MNFVETPIVISDHTHGQVHLLDVIVEFFDICLLEESEMRFMYPIFITLLRNIIFPRFLIAGYEKIVTS
jgi:hypothetical protein